MTPFAQAAAVAAIAFGTGATAVTMLNEDMPDYAVPEKAWTVGAALDGKVFYTTDRLLETGEILQDELHFKDGTFQSAMCQVYCDFGWSDYKTYIDGDTIHFTTTTTCPDAPHTVVWYGTVTGDTVQFEGTWTTRRWYWTRQLNAIGAGSTEGRPIEAPTG